MLDGIVVVFEVGLALLRMHQDALLLINDAVDLTHWLNRQIAAIYDPKILWSFVRPLFPNPLKLKKTPPPSPQSLGIISAFSRVTNLI
jgi:hypothetical protein